MPKLPAGYERVRDAPYELVARAEARAWAEAAARQGRLHDFAARQPDAIALHGRGESYSVPGAHDDRYVVRHYQRGGAVARMLHDRYLRGGATRPARELFVSDSARARGIPTPAVIAYAVYPAGTFYRADIATLEVPHAHDFAHELFGGAPRSAGERIDACAAAGKLLADIADKGLLHPDANIKNVLLQHDAHGVRGWILDLDGATLVERASPKQKRRLLARFARSVAKWEHRTGQRLSPEERRVLFAAAPVTGNG